MFAHGTRLSSDLGTPGYGIRWNDNWYRQTAGHNTVLLDGRSQPPATGRITQFRSTADLALAEGVVAWENGGYAGVEMRRVILWRETYFIDLFLASSTTPRQIDWVYHNCGELVQSLPGQLVSEKLSGDCGYPQIGDVRRIPASGSVELVWQASGVQLAIFFPMEQHSELFIGMAPDNPATEQPRSDQAASWRAGRFPFRLLSIARWNRAGLAARTVVAYRAHAVRTGCRNSGRVRTMAH